jgi:beta-glucuronidase
MLYPIVTESRSIIELNGIWDFKLDSGNGFNEQWHQTKLNDTIPMAVPSSYNDVGVTADIRNHVGWVWYEREFTVPSLLHSQRIILRFGSATHTAKVYVNGELVTEHHGGFTPFETEINPYLQSGKNRLTVAVNNIVDESTLPVGNYTEKEIEGVGKVIRNTPNFDFFNYAGLHRPIKIYTTPRKYIKDITIVTDIQGTNGQLDYEVEMVGGALANVSVMNQSGSIVGEGEGAQGWISIPNAKLWEPYERISIYAEGCVVRKW